MSIVSTLLTVWGQPSPRFHVEAWFHVPFRNRDMDYMICIINVSKILYRTLTAVPPFLVLPPLAPSSLAAAPPNNTLLY